MDEKPIRKVPIVGGLEAGERALPADLPQHVRDIIDATNRSLVSDSDAVVETWFVETFHNIGLDAPAFNRFRSAADELKRRLAKKE